MKVSTFVLITAAGMAATSLVVFWSTDPTGAASDKREVAGQAPTPVAAEPAPEDRASFEVGGTLMMAGRLGHAVLPAATDNETYLYVDVGALDAARAKEPARLDLSIVIDRSGSMRGKRLKNALSAAETAVERLRDGDAVNVVTYNTGTEVIVPRTVLAPGSREDILRRLRRVRAGGDTCISCGVETGMRLLAPAGPMVRRVLLLSDGEATAGVRDVAGFRRIAESCRRMGASVTTIGVDINYNERIMSALARGSNGRHFFVQDPSGLASIFDQEMESLKETVASDAKLAVDLAPGVLVTEVLDRAFDRRGSRVEVPLGSFSAGDHKTLLMRLRVPRGPAGERPVAAVRLRYDDLAKDGPGQGEGQLLARVSADPAEAAPLDGVVSARVSQSEAADALEEANQLARSGRVGEARRFLQEKRETISRRRRAAVRSLEGKSRREAEKRFDFASGAVDTGAAFDDGEGGAEAQIRQNAEDSFSLSE